MKKIPQLAISLVAPLATGLVGSLFTINAIPTWYATLHKPFFSPPNWLFGPVWTLLYILMGIACYLIWQKTHSKKQKKALQVYIVQLALNAIWTPLFFGLQIPFLALIEIVALWIAILMTIIAFYRLKPLAAWLLIPYLGWVTFATILNAAIVALN